MRELSWLLETPIAHRGLHDGNNLVAENSLPAFQRAAQAGYIIELDVHLAADGNVLVFHDETLQRLCGQERRVTSLVKADLPACRLGSTNACIPVIEDVLMLIAGSVPLLIELKQSSPAGRLEAALLDKLGRYSGQYAIQSFHPMSLAWFRKHAPQVARGQLASDFGDEKLPWIMKQVLRSFLLNGLARPDFIGYRAGDLPNARVDRQRRVKGRPVLAWTVRGEEERQRLLPHCDNIIFEGFIPA